MTVPLAVIGGVGGFAAGLILNYAAKRLGRGRFVMRLLRDLRNGVSDERILEILEDDPFFGRDYAREHRSGLDTAAS